MKHNTASWTDSSHSGRAVSMQNDQGNLPAINDGLPIYPPNALNRQRLRVKLTDGFGPAGE